MPRKRTTQEFIEESKIIHNFKFDYSLTNYLGGREKVIIICPFHGQFIQTPEIHVRGHGCKKCATEYMASKRTCSILNFISKANKIHNNKYDYTNSIYKKRYEKIEIICKNHGNFWQIVSNHLNGEGCPKCGIKTRTENLKSSLDEFIIKANKVHNYKYNYSNSIYINSNSKIEIICKIHGSFWQYVTNHIDKGCGCKLCGIDKRPDRPTKTNSQFISDAVLVHGNRYNYDFINYINCRKDVEIVCSVHGSFWQRASHHLSGCGCRKCHSLTSKPEMYWLDLLKIPNDKHHRSVSIYIPDKKIRYIADGFDPSTNTCYEFYGDYYHGNPKIFDLKLINKVTKTTFGELYEKTLKKEKVLKENGYNVVYIWETDFYKKYNITNSEIKNNKAS